MSHWLPNHLIGIPLKEYVLGIPYLIKSIFTLTCRGFTVKKFIGFLAASQCFPLWESIGFPYFIKCIAPSHVGDSPCLDNMIVHWLPNVSLGMPPKIGMSKMYCFHLWPFVRCRSDEWYAPWWSWLWPLPCSLKCNCFRLLNEILSGGKDLNVSIQGRMDMFDEIKPPSVECFRTLMSWKPIGYVSMRLECTWKCGDF